MANTHSKLKASQGLHTLRGNLKSGLEPSINEWNLILQESHRLAPGMTSDNLREVRNHQGQNSYQILADVAAPLSPRLTVDLGCGDGFLISYLLPFLNADAKVVGVDFSENEINLARTSFHDSRVSFHHGAGDSLPFRTGTVDLIVSHFALAFMMPIELVVQEIARVLKKGGRLAFTVPRFHEAEGLWQEVTAAVTAYFKKHYPALLALRHREGKQFLKNHLCDLFSSQLGFSQNIEWHDFDLIPRLTAKHVWQLIDKIYLAWILLDGEKQELQSEIDTIVARHIVKANSNHFKYPLRRITILKIP